MLDRQRWQATLGNKPLDLTRTEFSLLLHMAREPGKAFTRQELLDAVWGAGYLAGSNVVDQAVTGLRRKLGDDPRHPTFIETVTGIGYRLRAQPPKTVSPHRLRWAVAAAIAIALIGLAAGVSFWLAVYDGTAGQGRLESVAFHATAHVTDPGDVRAADCSDDMVISDVISVSEVSGDLTGELRAVSTTTLYENTGCLSGVSRSTSVFTDEEENKLEFVGEAPVITYRLPHIPETAVNHQNVSVTITGGSGKYAGVRGRGSCTTLSISEFVADELNASSESDCEFTLRIPDDGEPSSVSEGRTLELSASPPRLSVFGHEREVPSQGRFLAVIRNGGDESLREAVLTLPEPEGAAIQARASCGSVDDELCMQDESGAPPRGSRFWDLGDIAPGEEVRFQFTMQLLDAHRESIQVRLELDAQGLPQPLRSRGITMEVVR